MLKLKVKKFYACLMDHESAQSSTAFEWCLLDFCGLTSMLTSVLSDQGYMYYPGREWRTRRLDSYAIFILLQQWKRNHHLVSTIHDNRKYRKDFGCSSSWCCCAIPRKPHYYMNYLIQYQLLHWKSSTMIWTCRPVLQVLSYPLVGTNCTVSDS